LIDDEDAVREAARRVLEKAGYTVLAATNGETGLEIFRDFGDEISAVILDLSMPGMDGVEVFREIRVINPDMKVIIWSGFDEEAAVTRLAGIGASTFIEKPSHVRELALALKAALQPSAEAA
jgi:DNA-binding response OmpR family regulator